MKKKLLFVIGATIASSGIYSSSVFAANATGNATATVLAPLALTAGVGMDFGDVAGETGAASTIVLAPDGTTTASGNAVAGGTPAAGAFSVTGDDSLTYDINLPASTTLSGGAGPNITVNNFTDNKGGSSTTSGGTDDFTIGATLNLADGQGAGTYTGTYSVTIDYQ